MNESGLQSKKNNSLPVIKVKDLRVHFNLKDQVVKAVDGVSFDIKKGETIAIVGESGSGKSVTALSLMRLVDFSGGNIISGEINLETKNKINLDLAQQSQDIMKDIRGNDVSMIFQEPMTSLNPVFTIRMQMTETILKHQGKTRVEALEIELEMLKLVRIPEHEKRLNGYVLTGISRFAGATVFIFVDLYAFVIANLIQTYIAFKGYSNNKKLDNSK